MARSAIVVNQLGFNASLANITWTAADTEDGNYFTDDGQSILLCRNGHTAPVTVTITGVADARLRRPGNAAISVPAFATPASGVAMWGLHTADAWRQPSSNHVHVNVDHTANVSFAVISIHKR
jgi:hypothetical protein